MPNDFPIVLPYYVKPGERYFVVLIGDERVECATMRIGKCESPFFTSREWAEAMVRPEHVNPCVREVEITERAPNFRIVDA